MQQRPFDSRQPNISAARLNYAQIKEQEQLNRERQRQEEFKQEKHQNLVQRQRSQYGHVSSHGYGVQHGGRQEHTPTAPGSADDVEIRVFVRECDPDAQAFSFMESNVTTAQQEQHAPLQRNHQGAGAKPAVMFGRRASANAEERRGPQPATTPGRGEVPAYLLKRKAEMQHEKETIRDELERQKEAAQYPPGHRPVTEEERTAILAKLAQRKKELEMELNRLPMRFDTVAVRNKRQQIEGEMSEVDAAQQKFSVKKQLFVPI